VILVVLEGGKTLKNISLELIAAARGLGGPVTALCIGPDAKALAAEAAGAGADSALFVTAPEVAAYAPRAYARAVAASTAKTGAKVILLGATSTGRDLAPRLSARLGAGLASDVVEIRLDEGHLVAKRPVYAGKAFLTVRVETPVAIATIRPNAFPRAGRGPAASAEECAVDFEPRDTDGAITSIEMGDAGKVELTEADIVVSGGRGLKGPENFHLVEELAAALGGAVGASRAVVDAGWRPHPEQVGQTGKTVSPTLYIACGISGAVQHMAGMSSSKIIVAINKDPDAPIFSVADYGVVGDALEIIPPLVKEVAALRG